MGVASGAIIACPRHIHPRLSFLDKYKNELITTNPSIALEQKHGDDQHDLCSCFVDCETHKNAHCPKPPLGSQPALKRQSTLPLSHEIRPSGKACSTGSRGVQPILAAIIHHHQTSTSRAPTRTSSHGRSPPSNDSVKRLGETTSTGDATQAARLSRSMRCDYRAEWDGYLCLPSCLNNSLGSHGGGLGLCSIIHEGYRAPGYRGRQHPVTSHPGLRMIPLGIGQRFLMQAAASGLASLYPQRSEPRTEHVTMMSRVNIRGQSLSQPIAKK